MLDSEYDSQEVETYGRFVFNEGNGSDVLHDFLECIAKIFGLDVN